MRIWDRIEERRTEQLIKKYTSLLKRADEGMQNELSLLNRITNNINESELLKTSTLKRIERSKNLRNEILSNINSLQTKKGKGRLL